AAEQFDAVCLEEIPVGQYIFRVFRMRDVNPRQGPAVVEDVKCPKRFAGIADLFYTRERPEVVHKRGQPIERITGIEGEQQPLVLVKTQVLVPDIIQLTVDND